MRLIHIDVVVDLHLDRVPPDSTHKMHKITVSANEGSLGLSPKANQGSLGMGYNAVIKAKMRLIHVDVVVDLHLDRVPPDGTHGIGVEFG
jgi:hypothetical protein